tara:strand:- start:48 stop:329 length:282 start_codon:yes stop_codon:yes gene_type:complete
MKITRNKQKYDYQGNLLNSVLLNISWETIKRERKQELDNSDWRFMSDQSPSPEWINYRQFLRDLPQNYYDESDKVSQGANAAADAWNEYTIPE